MTPANDSEDLRLYSLDIIRYAVERKYTTGAIGQLVAVAREVGCSDKEISRALGTNAR